MRRPRLEGGRAQTSGLRHHHRPTGGGGVTHVVNGILQVQDSVLQRVADVTFGVAGRGDLFIKRSFHQLLVLERFGGRSDHPRKRTPPPLASPSPPHLDEDLPAQLVGRGQLVGIVVHRLGEQQVSKHLLEVRGHVPLLDHAAVVLDGQDHRVPGEDSAGERAGRSRGAWSDSLRGYEGVLFDGVEHVQEFDLRG